MVEGTFSILESCLLCKHLWNTSPEHRHSLSPLVGCAEIPRELSAMVSISVNTVHTGKSFHSYRKRRLRGGWNSGPVAYCVPGVLLSARDAWRQHPGIQRKNTSIFLAYFFCSPLSTGLHLFIAILLSVFSTLLQAPKPQLLIRQNHTLHRDWQVIGFHACDITRPWWTGTLCATWNHLPGITMRHY